MSWADKVPRAGNLYIGGLYALYQTEEIKAANVTHVLSVINEPLDVELFKPFRHFAIDVEDDEDENLLQYFVESNRFIEDGLERGGGVLVHCAIGKSRSATIIVAYLMHKFHISRNEALSQLREGRPVCGPNYSFMEQLEIYHRMLQARDAVEAESIYQRWLHDQCQGNKVGRLASALSAAMNLDDMFVVEPEPVCIKDALP